MGSVNVIYRRYQTYRRARAYLVRAITIKSRCLAPHCLYSPFTLVFASPHWPIFTACLGYSLLTIPMQVPSQTPCNVVPACCVQFRLTRRKISLRLLRRLSKNTLPILLHRTSIFSPPVTFVPCCVIFSNRRGPSVPRWSLAVSIDFRTI